MIELIAECNWPANSYHIACSAARPTTLRILWKLLNPYG